MFKKTLFAGMVALFASAAANANVISYKILDLSNEGQATTTKYTGTGYVGMYSNSFNGIFGLEMSNVSRTALEVDVTSLAGKSIDSAYLKYTDAGTTETISLQAFTANGTLGFVWDAPNNLLSGTATSIGGSNSIDVTNYLKAGLATNTNWFGLHLQGTSAYQWIGANRSGKADNAKVSLVVNYSDVPEPGSLALCGLGIAGLAAFARKSAHKKAA